MKREKEYLYKIEFRAENGRTIAAHIAYRPDRYRPWTVDIDWTEMSPTYQTIGAAQAYLRKHYASKNNPNCAAMHYMQKSLLFDTLQVKPCDR